MEYVARVSTPVRRCASSLTSSGCDFHVLRTHAVGFSMARCCGMTCYAETSKTLTRFSADAYAIWQVRCSSNFYSMENTCRLDARAARQHLLPCLHRCTSVLFPLNGPATRLGPPTRSRLNLAGHGRTTLWPVDEVDKTWGAAPWWRQALFSCSLLVPR